MSLYVLCKECLLKGSFMKRKLKEYLKENLTDIITIIISGIALVVSIFTNIQNRALKERYDRLSTYNMDLNYQLDFSNELDENIVSFNNGLIEIDAEDHIVIDPKVGGIQKVYMIHYNEGEVIAVFQLDLFTNYLVNEIDAQNGYYEVGEYCLDIIDENENKYYSKLFIVVEDFKHNFYSNMIIYEIDKADISKMDIRVYNEVDLLYTYNQSPFTVLPEFDSKQLKEYLSFKDKLDKIL